jgi:chemotaxis protein MotB
MAEKKGQIIVIKKIIVAGAGHHGGSWKVALADFMTAMMAFFLVMWLLGQSEETKKAVSDYFSSPSVIEYNFQNFGVEVTLEKLFLDLVNEPLKAFQSFLEPVDKTPNLLDMGSAKVVSAYMADQLTDYAKNTQVHSDGFNFDIPDTVLFEKGTSKPSKEFIKVMEKVRGVTSGLTDAEVQLESALFIQAIPEATAEAAQKIAFERLDLVKNKVTATLEHSSVDVKGRINVKEKKGEVDPQKLIGFIRVNIVQKDVSSDGQQRRKLESIFSDSAKNQKSYQDYIAKIGQKDRKGGDAPTAAESRPIKPLVNPVDEELSKINAPTEN